MTRRPPHWISPAILAIIFLPMISNAGILDEIRWKYRALVVVAPTSDDKFLAKLQQAWTADRAKVDDRDLRLIIVLSDGRVTLDEQGVTATEAKTIAARFGSDNPTFCMHLIGKDGDTKSSFDQPDLPPVFAAIDSMPMRQREITDR